MLKKIISIVIIVIGCAVAALGVYSYSDGIRCSDYSYDVQIGKDGGYSVSPAKFGADFYTYMYDGSYTMVNELDDIIDNTKKTISELNEIDKGLAKSISNSIVIGRKNVQTSSLIIAAIGALIFVVGLKSFAEAFSCEKKITAPAPVSQQSPAPVAPASAPEIIAPVTAAPNNISSDDDFPEI